jgi:hypothetical protein
MPGYGDPPKGKPFVKGDPRINRKGRPKDFDAVRKLAQQLANEEAKGAGGQLVVIDNEIQTNVTMVLRQLMKDNPVAFLQYAYGKPKEELDVQHSGQVVVNWDAPTDSD